MAKSNIEFIGLVDDNKLKDKLEKQGWGSKLIITPFKTQKELDKYLADKEEAIKRNHRKIGKELELFAIYDEIGQGLPVWLPKGYAMRRALEDYMISLERRYGYQHILTPHIHKEGLLKHLDI